MEVKENPLSLKVMRLSKPSLFNGISVTCDTRDLPQDIFNKQAKNDIAVPLPDTGIGQVLLLPQSFGNIYLGEMFSCCICIHNGSSENYDASIKVVLQMNNQSVPLLETEVNQLQSNDLADNIVNHEVKEIGTHILVCTVSYKGAESTEQNFRKFFKFQVLKPLDVKTKFYNAESDEVYLEAAIQNITAGPIFLEKVILEPNAYYNVIPLNTIVSDETTGPDSVFGCVRSLSPQDIYQYLFCLQPGPEAKTNIGAMKQMANIGKLDIVWRTSMGDRGRLQTSQLQRMILPSQYGDVKVNIESIPNTVRIEEPFEVSLRITNISDKDLCLYLEFLPGDGATEWHCATSRQLGKLSVTESATVNLLLMPLKTGFQTVAGIRLTDTFLKRTYDYENLSQVFVVNEMSEGRKELLSRWVGQAVR